MSPGSLLVYSLTQHLCDEKGPATGEKMRLREETVCLYTEMHIYSLCASCQLSVLNAETLLM